MIKGKHLIAGEWVSGDSTFESSPSTGEPKTYPNGTSALVDQASPSKMLLESGFHHGIQQESYGLVRALFQYSLHANHL